jgi:hypothetical protein
VDMHIKTTAINATPILLAFIGSPELEIDE